MKPIKTNKFICCDCESEIDQDEIESHSCEHYDEVYRCSICEEIYEINEEAELCCKDEKFEKIEMWECSECGETYEDKEDAKECCK